GVAAVAGEEDRVADRDRARGARPRQPGLPDDVLGLGPGHGKPLVVADAQAARPAELHPVRGQRGGDDRKTETEGEAESSAHGGYPTLGTALASERLY